VPTATTTERPIRVLFIGDDGSTQIAASLLRLVVGDRADVSTAGADRADPGSRTDEMLVAMGLDPADERRLSARVLRSADRVIVLGADLDVARLAGPRYEEWDVTRDDLISRVEALGDELTAPPAEIVHQSVLVRLRTLLEAVTSRR
jgi:hypothetical protein